MALAVTPLALALASIALRRVATPSAHRAARCFNARGAVIPLRAGGARQIKLKPAEHQATRGDNPDDESAVRECEREVREHRARVEPFTLTRAEERVDTTWWVAGESASPRSG